MKYKPAQRPPRLRFTKMPKPLSRKVRYVRSVTTALIVVYTVAFVGIAVDTILRHFPDAPG